MEAGSSRNEEVIAPELYFLIAKFLTAGPCQDAAKVLKEELERIKILPQRLDWEGNLHNQSFEELEQKYSHIGTQHLLKICARIGPVLEKEIPPCIPGAVSLLGAGKQSLLRTKADLLQHSRGITLHSGRLSGKSFMRVANSSVAHNVVKVLQGRENSGPLSRHDVIQSSFYSKLQLYRHTLGHLSAVYCVLYDRTGKYVITGADDLLVKVWSSSDGRLLATFRGASAEIMDIAVNFDNTLLAAGSLDKVLRVWCFQTMSPVAVLSGHSGMITSVKFCPISSNGIYYLVSTSSDGSVAFWSHTKKMNERAVFQPKPIQYHEKMRPGQAQMICASFSSGGAFMAAGSADHHVRVYAMIGDEGPRRVLEVEAHSDTVDSIQWCNHNGLKFISGSKDGTANVWHFEQQQWMHKRLVMTTKLPGEPEADEESNKKAKVTMVNWDSSDEFVITAVNDSSLKVWNARTAELVKVLRGHKDEVFVLESHPIDPRIILSAGHDGQLIIWDVLKSDPIACFQNFIQGQGNGAVFDAKWSPDGTMLAATDSHGHLMMYGFGSGVELLKIVPKELFFHTDYRPLIRDSNNYVLDEQTQTAPHLMPPPFLVDVDGNPYPPALQRLVPGRENCRGEQLVPNIAVGAGGMQEVIEGLPSHEPRSNIDRLIEALAQRQNINDNAENERDDNQGEAPLRQISSPRGNRPGLRRVGDVEGVRQSSGNWQRDNTTPWNKPILVKPLNPAILETQLNQINAMAEMELESWRREMQRRPKIVSTGNEMQGGIGNRLNRNRRNRATRHGYRTRAAREDEQDEEEYGDPDAVASSGSSASSNSNDSSADEADICSDSSSSNASSEYSDWMADHGVNLEPPKRSKRKPVKKRSVTPQSDTDRRRSQRPKKKIVPTPDELEEVPEAFRPTEWLTEVIPRKAPYYPQMGDEIVYFRQGHQFYMDAVKKKKVYELGPRCEPWSKMTIKAMEYVKVVGIKYEIRPPRLCCLKLAIMDEDGRLTGENFTIKYHDMADVLDFLVLRQTFETALARSWSLGDRFRCMIDDGWWMGQIQSMEPLDENFPDSYFMCFHVRWDNGEIEKMSPWDLEPIDEERLPDVVGGAVPVLPEEIQAILYQPQTEEWPMGDREATCRRIIRGLDQVMSLAIAEPFVVPVDLNIYPSYALVVEYPIDLSTIKARFENHFYRRITSAQFDVRYLATNAEEFNKPHSQIVKQARIVTDLCLKIINRDTTELDVAAVYHQLVDTYHSSESDIDVEENSEKPSTSRVRSPIKRLRSHTIAQDWKTPCRQLLETLWQCEDSVPFREPVDRLEHADYYQIIDTAMDLRTVKEDLSGGNYETPLEFAKDMKLIFTNSRTYNTNKRSKIYTMTIRLSAMFDELMRKIISDWKSAKRRMSNEKGKSNGKTKVKGKGKTIMKGGKRLTNGAGPSREFDSSDENDANTANYDDFDDDDDDDDDSTRADGPGPSRLANGHVKRAGTSSRPGVKLRLPRKASPKKNQLNYGEMSDSEVSESESSESEPIRRTRSMKAIASDVPDSDSEESYKPGGRGKQTKKNRAKNSKLKTIKPKQKQKIEDDDDEDEEDQEEEEEEEEENEDETEVFPSNQRIFVAQSSEESEHEVIRRNSSRACKVVNKIVSQNASNDNSISESAEEERNNGSNDPQDSDSHDINSPVKSTRSQTRSQVSQDSDSQDGTQSSRRRGKRPRYNEDSEDSNGEPVRNRRSVKRRYYAEESDESIPEVRNGITISSRGRVRKMTARARAYLLDSP